MNTHQRITEPQPYPLTHTPLQMKTQEASTSWTFSVFDLTDRGVTTPMSTLCFFLLKTSGLVAYFKLDAGRLAAFLRRIEDGYVDSNPYHNR